MSVKEHGFIITSNLTEEEDKLILNLGLSGLSAPQGIVKTLNFINEDNDLFYNCNVNIFPDGASSSILVQRPKAKDKTYI